MISSILAAAVTGYSCSITIFASDLPSAAKFSFERPVVAEGSHGGAPLEFTSGTHKVAVLADGKWRGLIWQREDKMIAQVLTAKVDVISDDQVMILYNPANLDEQVDLVCDPLTAANI